VVIFLNENLSLQQEISGLTEEGEPPPELCVGKVLREADLVQAHSVQDLGPAHLPQQENDLQRALKVAYLVKRVCCFLAKICVSDPYSFDTDPDPKHW
jgi:hypothetical protein